MKNDEVNVVEYVDNKTKAVKGFPDDVEGGKKAEDFFVKVAIENGMAAGDAADSINDGYYARDNYQVFIFFPA